MYYKTVQNTLGHKVFEEKREVKPSQHQTLFYIKSTRGADARGEPTSDGFVVLKGSKVAISTVPSITQNFSRFRDELIISGVITESNGIMEISEDYVFSSPSTAAVIVMGRNANGLTEWKLKTGTSLKEFESGKKD